jgi:GNAT superfamily N-acetyltransferase
MDDHYIPVAIVQYAWVHDYGPHIRVGHRKASLNDLYVLEQCQRQGVGKHLFIAVKQWCKTRNVKWLEWQSNESAVPFYEKLGYKGERCPDPDHPEFEIEFETHLEDI